MSTSSFEGALDRMLASGSPAAIARAVSTEGQMLLGPYRSVISATHSLPTSPLAGDSYIVPVGDVGATLIAMFGADGVWHFSTASEGDVAYVQDVETYYAFIGGAWQPTSSPAPDSVVGGADKTTNYVALATDGGKTVRFNTKVGGAALSYTVNAAFGSLGSLWEVTVERSLSDDTANAINVLDTTTPTPNGIGPPLAPNNGRTVATLKIRADGTHVYAVGTS